MTPHPITPPPELVMQWSVVASTLSKAGKFDGNGRLDHISFIATKAAQWGADQELEACCEWLNDIENTGFNSVYRKKFVEGFRADRRPELPSKAQALTALHAVVSGANDMREQRQDFETIRLALEKLED